MSKYTPGPWAIRRIAEVPGAICGGVTRQYMRGVGTDQLAMVCSVQPDNGGDEAMEANARLIAAAPELLEALEWLLDDVGRASSMLGAVKARAAIAKATGEQR